MKTVVSKELMVRLQNAAANGSVVASGILSELKNGKDNAEIIRGNPQALWFRENRADVEPSTFAGYFKNLPEYDSQDLNFFANALWIYR